MLKPFLLWTVIILAAIPSCFAGDTTYHKHPWLMSGSAGYTINKAFGTVMDNEYEFNAMSRITDARQKNWGGFELAVGFQKQVGQYFYIRTGLSYLQKQVNPEEGGFMLYKDSLKTGYLSIPVIGGVNVPLNQAKTILFLLEAGASADFRLINNTTSGIDRAGFKTCFATVAVQGGAGFAFDTHAGARAFIRYNYMVNVTDAYQETLYWGGVGNPYKTFTLKFKTQVISLGWQWEL